jgi:hypothetical protein
MRGSGKVTGLVMVRVVGERGGGESPREPRRAPLGIQLEALNGDPTDSVSRYAKSFGGGVGKVDATGTPVVHTHWELSPFVADQELRPAGIVRVSC